MCKLAILDKFTLFASGIESILKITNDCEIVHATSCEELFKQFKDSAPDVIIIDVIHGDNSGMRSIKKIRRTYPQIPVLLILSQNYSDCFEEYIRLGVKGFVFNDASGKDLIEAIKRLKEGGEFFRKKVWDIFKTSIQRRKYGKKKSQFLTDREVSVLKLFSSGLTYKEIGARLNISPRTVETHKRNILAKLKINTTADMVKYAYRNHIISK
ncbi:response regulator transcription factor [Draconibacterium sp. IB214405]|uniref:response regulator transcription factor n=1 Tax=Draconibacterium sp. IB214405 TaxID=3097352 RepID=UPI002A0AE16A|nr:response regulator transcription factor [Draconibacterium sp. IB214405]MDX8341413.1 response regulator transcription factor [Draconibacterium sp. IB214405]